MKQATSLWKWGIPDNYQNKMIGIYNRERSPDRFEFQKGEIVDILNSIPSFSFAVKSIKLKKFDVLPNNSGAPLVNMQVISLLNEICKSSFQIIDVEIQTEDGLLEGIKLLNITRLINTIDLEKSKYSLISGSKNIRSFQNKVHKLEEIPSNLLARELLFKSHITVANDIFEAFSFYKIKGVQFNPCAIR